MIDQQAVAHRTYPALFHILERLKNNQKTNSDSWRVEFLCSSNFCVHIKFHWNTAMPIHLLIVYDNLHSITELNNCDRDHVP